MERDKNRIATAAIIVCMVSAVSTLPAFLIAGILQQPIVNNYYQTTTTTTPITNTTTITYTNTTYNINGTYPTRTCHFANVTKLIPYSTTGANNVTVCDIPLVNRTIVTSMVAFSFDRRVGGSSFKLYSTLNDKLVDFAASPSISSGFIDTNSPYYSIWNNLMVR